MPKNNKNHNNYQNNNDNHNYQNDKNKDKKIEKNPKSKQKEEKIKEKDSEQNSKEDSRLELNIPEMNCASCAGKIEKSLKPIKGIKNYDILTTNGKVKIQYNSDKTSKEEITSAIEKTGYTIEEKKEIITTSEGDSIEKNRQSVWKSNRAIKTWIAGLFLGLGLVATFGIQMDFQILSILGKKFTLTETFFLTAIAFGVPVILRNGFYSAKSFSLDIDFLMSAAILSALLASLFFNAELYFEATALVFLFNLAELLEDYSMDRTRNSLKELMDLSPNTAIIKKDGKEVEKPVEEVNIGDIVIVKPGDKIPMDGEVIKGESAVNQSPITGESLPVDKTPGDEVFAGTINEEGYLEVEVTKEAAHNTLSKIVEMVQDAESNQTKREQFVERFSKYYTPFMVTIAILTAVIPPIFLGLSWSKWFLAGITMLVLACPCAFVISTPVTVVSGITNAAKNGVLIKGGNYLESMGEINAIAFDKTGTLTKGELVVTDIIPINNLSEREVLQCARGLETRSEHPIGEAIVEKAREKGTENPEVEEFESITGKGVKAKISGKRHYAGKPDLFDGLGFDLSHVHTAMDHGELTKKSIELCERNDCMDLINEKVPKLQSEGKTVIIVGNEDRIEGLIAVADEVKEEAKKTIEKLNDLGIKTIMLTGDNKRTAKAIAEKIGIQEFYGELLPEEKVEKIESLVEKYDGVAMVGDGVNDAPALATSTVGIAMGAAGTDTALETADIALMNDNLMKIPHLYMLSHKANKIIKQNIFSSLGIKALLALGVPLGYVGVAVAVLVGDAGMTLGVTGNAMRLSDIEI